MKGKIKRDKKIKVMLSIIIVLFVSISFAYAFFGVNLGLGTSSSIGATTGQTDSLAFHVGNAINIHASLENFYEGHENLHGETTATASLKANDVTNQATGRYNVFFIIDTNDFEYSTLDGQAELIMKVTDPTGKEIENITGLKKVEGGFDITTRTGGFLIMPNYDIEATPEKTLESHDWKLEVTLVNLNSDQNKNMGKSLSGRFYITTEELSTYELAKVNAIEAKASHNSITANMQIIEGSEKVDKYYYAIEEEVGSLALLGVGNTLRLANEIKANLEYTESDVDRYTFNDLVENTSYVVYGYVKDKQGMISNIYQTTIVTEDYVLPKIESIEKSNITLNSITLKVNAANGSNEIVKYYFSKDNGETYVESESNTYTFNNLLDTTEYKIKVKVKDSEGRFSTVYHDAVATQTYINPKITSVDTTITYNSVGLSVNATSGTNSIAKYYYSKDNGSTWSEASTSNLYKFDGLEENKEYSFKVKVEDTLGRFTEYQFFATTNAYKLPTITNVAATTTFTSIGLNVSATSGDGTIQTYYYSKDDGSTWSTSTSNSYTFSGLNHGTTFYIKVKVVDSNGRESVEYSKTVATDTRYVSTYIKSLYTSQGANGLYYHSSSLGNSAGDNSYRYAGADPNNYICFGATISPCPDDNLYRIIGVFGNQIKIMKADYASNMLLGRNGAFYNNLAVSSYDTYKGSQPVIPGYYWNSTNGTSSVNTWSASNLNTINLNTNYLNNIGSAWASKIATTTWNVGGLTSANALNTNAKTTYNYEVGANKSSTTYNAKIGLIYLSDYYYAASPTYWTYVGYNSSDSTKDYRAAVNNNWMTLGFWDWTISRNSDNTIGVLDAARYGEGAAAANPYSYHAGIRPTFNLASTVTLKSGSGTKSSPYYIEGISTATSTINNVTTSSTYNSITATISSTIGSATMKEYYYSLDNGSNWTKVNNYVFTISGLTSGTSYSIKIKGVDANNKETNVYTLTASTTSTFATYVRSLYTSQGTNGIFYHSSSLVNGAGDNSYRYAGADPNNYVCFGSTASTCPTDNLYRIIGVFDDRIKLIKFDYAQDSLLGVDGDRRVGYAYNISSGNYPNYKGALTNPHSYYWNYSSDNSSLNNWSESRLNKTNLNTNFINRIGSAWSGKIATTTWYVGGATLANSIAGTSANAKNAYNYEIGSSKSAATYSARIGLPYLSEYYYAAAPTYWTYQGYTSNTYLDKNGNYGETYDYRAARSSNWMDNGMNEWFISRTSDYTQSSYLTGSSGGFSWTYVYNDRLVRPTFTLDGNVLRASGTGTKASPYRISTTQSGTAPIVTSLASVSVSSSSVTLSVNANAGTNAISKFLFSRDGTNWYEATGYNHSRYTFSGLSSNTSYTFRVKAVDANGVESSIYTKTIKTSYVNPSVTSVSTSVGTTSITVTANASAGSASLKYYYFSRDGGSSWYSVSSSATSASYTFSGLASNTTYSIAVKVYDTNNYVSSVYYTSATTQILFATYIKSLYTGDGNNGLYYHDGNGSPAYNNWGYELSDYSYRYTGANPNNYVCFGSDATSCPTDNTYRIIGVFGNQVKLIKYMPLGGGSGFYYWSGSSSNYSNVWANSTLNTNILNGTYLNGFTTTWRNKIATATWYVGGVSYETINSTSLTAKTFYNEEVGSNRINTTYNAKVGLMYISDYYYAASPTYWVYGLKDPSWSWGAGSHTLIDADDWMKIPSGQIEWTITRISDISYNAAALYYMGDIITIEAHSPLSSYSWDLRPTFYLNTTVKYVSGTGSYGNPYRIT